MGYEAFLNIADVFVRIKSKVPPEADDEYSYRYKNIILDKKPVRLDIDLNLELRPDFTKHNPELFFRTEKKTVIRPNEYNQPKIRYLGKDLVWRLGEINKKLLLEGGPSTAFQLYIDKNLEIGTAYLIKKESGWKISDVVYGFLEVLLIYYLAKYKLGIVVHSAGINDQENGYLFAGPSQAGKSTTGGIWYDLPGVRVLNDDRIIIRKEKRRFFMYSNPWCGNFSECLKQLHKKAELKKIFFIYHSKINKTTKLSPKESFARFFPCFFPPFWDSECLLFSTEFLFDVILNVPCHSLGFKNDKKIISFVRKIR